MLWPNHSIKIAARFHSQPHTSRQIIHARERACWFTILISFRTLKVYFNLCNSNSFWIMNLIKIWYREMWDWYGPSPINLPMMLNFHWYKYWTFWVCSGDSGLSYKKNIEIDGTMRICIWHACSFIHRMIYYL